MALIDRFWAKVDRSGDCWLWTGARNPFGYAQIRKGAASAGKIYVHRVAYELAKGPIPTGLEIDHLCKVRHCVNPEHLEAVTRRENILRSEAPAGLHAVKTHCPQGHTYDETNTYQYRGMRYCRICRDAHRLRHRLGRV